MTHPKTHIWKKHCPPNINDAIYMTEMTLFLCTCVYEYVCVNVTEGRDGKTKRERIKTGSNMEKKVDVSFCDSANINVCVSVCVFNPMHEKLSWVSSPGGQQSACVFKCVCVSVCAFEYQKDSNIPFVFQTKISLSFLSPFSQLIISLHMILYMRGKVTRKHECKTFFCWWCRTNHTATSIQM